MNAGVTDQDLSAARKQVARVLLGLYKTANAGHIGSSLSCLEILIEIFGRQSSPDDVLVLSKGHAAAALYAVLAHYGRLDPALLATFYKDGTVLAAHPPCGRQLPAIPFGTGSLGHGLSLAAGLAFADRFTQKPRHVYCVLSDGDCNEGSTWEAALFASHHRLANLTVIVDRNRLQGFGGTEDIAQLEPFSEKWASFGFDVRSAEQGNHFSSLHAALEAGKQSPTARCVIANTIKGHGVSYMQNKMEWHYLPMNDTQYAQALAELDA